MTTTNTTAASACPYSSGSASKDFDPFEMDYQLNPGEACAWARENEPIFYSEKLGYWVVTRFDDVQEVFRDQSTYSASVALEKLTPATPEAQEILEAKGYGMRRTLVNEDEPAHTARRRALAGPFDVAHLDGEEEMVRELVTGYIDRFAADGRADLVNSLLWEVPLTVAFHFLGVPEHDMDMLRRYSVAHTVNTWGRPSPEQQEEIAENVGNFWNLAGDILAELRETPDAPGWMPYSIRAQQEQPEVVTDSYLHSIMMAGIVAAHETTAHSASNAIKLLLENRSVWEELVRRPELIPNAIEECLRLSGGVAAWRRITTRPTVLGGQRLDEGERLLIVSAAANRDPRHFNDPDVIDLYRDNSTDHLTFGFGSHQCLGKNLARLELQVILQELTSRFPSMRLVDQEFEFVPNTSFRGPEHLWVEWDADTRAAGTAEDAPPEFPGIVFNGPGKDLRTRTMTVEKVRPLTPHVMGIRLVPDGGPLPGWQPGAHVEIDAGDVSRRYSLCGSSSDAWEIAVAREPDGRGGSRWIHENVVAGATVRVRGPRQNFAVDPDVDRRILIAGGIGITPILALADDAKARGIDYTVHYCGPERDRMAYLDRLRDDHGDHLVLHVSGEGTRLDLPGIVEEYRAGTQVCTCGPDRLTDAVLEAFSSWPEGTVTRESFQSTSAVDPSSNEPFEVTVNSTGQVLDVPAGQTLLETLETSGFDVDADCREGLCGTCVLGVVDAAPEDIDHRDDVLSARERQSGAVVMPCVSRSCAGKPLTLDL
ncbi:cytochrome P450/oxidoreductase [Corynebacterium kalidii]|uniref:Cytochrome P450/oxidoreductase n=1 Tax=Corynebacterium kalidii TaxID=2931982 RepID=A0A9X1WL07_9CORY|nr:cytochrome P450/oxidoreductase [Corynebacterium kalidii]MCJ7858407.1 cytochrome P450/oxidoreductase [Corynebacterium kalidii]